MEEYIIGNVRTRKAIVLGIVTAIAIFVLGIVIGYFSGRNSRNTDNDIRQGKSVCNSIASTSPEVTSYIKRYVERHSTKHTCVAKSSDCMDFDLPRNYIAYHLNGRSIKIDGKIDEAAWEEVPWSEPFVDIRSAVFPKPYLDTMFKLRWDDSRLYIGAYIQETNLWGTADMHDAKLHYENNFEVFMDVDGDLMNYKQLQINVLGTMMDQIFYKSPHDAADKTANKLREWVVKVQKAVYTDGTVNKPGDSDKYWSVEMSLTFESLSDHSVRKKDPPFDNETWFMQFGRAEYRLNVTNGRYVKPKSSKPDWWSWQPCDAINLQLQDRWGLVQFKKNIVDSKFSFPKWHIYKALFETYSAVKVYIGVNSKITTQVYELDLPPYLFSGMCVEVPQITKTMQGFTISVVSKLLPNMVGYINQDRYVTFN